jgi:hypothetical protein
LSWGLNNRRYFIGSVQSGEDQMRSEGKAKAGASAGCREAVEFYKPLSIRFIDFAAEGQIARFRQNPP